MNLNVSCFGGSSSQRPLETTCLGSHLVAHKFTTHTLSGEQHSFACRNEIKAPNAFQRQPSRILVNLSETLIISAENKNEALTGKCCRDTTQEKELQKEKKKTPTPLPNLTFKSPAALSQETTSFMLKKERTTLFPLL